MSEELGFLDALKQNPDDHTTRLIYADWLDEHEKPEKAALLRNGVAARAAEDAEDQEKWCALVPLIENCQYKRDANRPVISAGRVDEINGELVWQLTADDFMKPDMRNEIALYGHLFTVHITEIGEEMEKLAVCEHLALLDRLTIQDNNLDEYDASILANSPHTGKLTSLDMSNNRIGDRGAKAIFHSSRLHCLTRLNLHNNLISFYDDEDILPEHPKSLHRLDDLNLSRNPGGVDAAAALANWPHSAGLKKLHLAETSLSNRGAMRLAESVYLKPVKLDLSRNGIHRQGISLLLNSDMIEHVTDLDVSRNRLYDIGEDVIAHSRASSLKHLFVKDNHMTSRGADALVRIPSLKTLDIGENVNIPKKKIQELNETAKTNGRALVVLGKWDKNRTPGDAVRRAPMNKWSRLIQEAEPQDRGITARTL